MNCKGWGRKRDLPNSPRVYFRGGSTEQQKCVVLRTFSILNNLNEYANLQCARLGDRKTNAADDDQNTFSYKSNTLVRGSLFRYNITPCSRFKVKRRFGSTCRVQSSAR
jgi:hypothetical protein